MWKLDEETKKDLTNKSKNIIERLKYWIYNFIFGKLEYKFLIIAIILSKFNLNFLQYGYYQFLYGDIIPGILSWTMGIPIGYVLLSYIIYTVFVKRLPYDKYATIIDLGEEIMNKLGAAIISTCLVVGVVSIVFFEEPITEWRDKHFGEDKKVEQNINDNKPSNTNKEEPDMSGVYKNEKDEGIKLSKDTYVTPDKTPTELLAYDEKTNTFTIRQADQVIEVRLAGVDLFTSEVDVGNDVAINKELSVQYPGSWVQDYFTLQDNCLLYVEVINDSQEPHLVKFHDNTGLDFTERLLKYGLAVPSDTSNNKYLELEQEAQETLTGFFFKPTIYEGNSSPENQ